MRHVRKVSRNFEMILGIVGSTTGLFSVVYLAFLYSSEPIYTTFLGLSAILGSFLGYVSTFYLKKHEDHAGMGFIVATILVIIGASSVNVLSALFLLVAGLSTLFRK